MLVLAKIKATRKERRSGIDFPIWECEFEKLPVVSCSCQRQSRELSGKPVTSRESLVANQRQQKKKRFFGLRDASGMLTRRVAQKDKRAESFKGLRGAESY